MWLFSTKFLTVTRIRGTNHYGNWVENLNPSAYSTRGADPGPTTDRHYTDAYTDAYNDYPQQHQSRRPSANTHRQRRRKTRRKNTTVSSSSSSALQPYSPLPTVDRRKDSSTAWSNAVGVVADWMRRTTWGGSLSDSFAEKQDDDNNRAVASAGLNVSLACLFFGTIHI